MNREHILIILISMIIAACGAPDCPESERVYTDIVCHMDHADNIRCYNNYYCEE